MLHLKDLRVRVLLMAASWLIQKAESLDQDITVLPEGSLTAPGELRVQVLVENPVKAWTSASLYTLSKTHSYTALVRMTSTQPISQRLHVFTASRCL